jgi:hypothetical protein
MYFDSHHSESTLPLEQIRRRPRGSNAGVVQAGQPERLLQRIEPIEVGVEILAGHAMIAP